MVRYSNRHGLHPALEAAVTWEQPARPAEDFRVTTLTRPPLIAYLEMVHDHEIEVDVGDRLDILDGQGVHQALEMADVKDALQEEQLSMELDTPGGSRPWLVTGRPDWYRDGTISDFKRTKVANRLYPTRTSYVMQLNFYAVLVRSYGFPVDRIEEVQIFKDWDRRRRNEEGYPYIAQGIRPVELWTDEVARVVMAERIALHLDARAGNPRFCDDEDRWAKPETYAVMIAGQKKAAAVFGQGTKRGGGLEEAEALIELAPAGASLEVRHGDRYVRCRDWCDVAPWCPQLKEEGMTIK